MADTWPIAPTYDDAILRQARLGPAPIYDAPRLTFGSAPAPMRQTTSAIADSLFSAVGFSTGTPAPAPSYDDAILRQARLGAARTTTGTRADALAGFSDLVGAIFARMGAASVPAAEAPPVQRASWGDGGGRGSGLSWPLLAVAAGAAWLIWKG